MSLIKPFRGLRPAEGHAADVAAPPYDVVDRTEASLLVEGHPWSFLHVSRPEIDLPDEVDPYDPRVYDKGRENLELMLSRGVLQRDPAACYYAYRLTMGSHCQTGLVATAAVEAYELGRIRKHEHTRPKKEDDRVRQIDALNAQTGPVFMVYRADLQVDGILRDVTAVPAQVDIRVERDQVRHEIWPVDDQDRIRALTAAFAAMPAIYVADGHHRSAAAARVCAARRMANPRDTGGEGYNYMLCCVFPHDQMQILSYNRIVRDLNGHTPDEVFSALTTAFDVEPSDQPVSPACSGEFGMYVAGRWYRLRLRDDVISMDDPVARLDVSMLQSALIEPILGIADPRRDERIDFIGGVRGLDELAHRVDSGAWAVAFSLYPTTIQALMAVADADRVMPPKSTWFEPKLADGLVSHVLD